MSFVIFLKHIKKKLLVFRDDCYHYIFYILFRNVSVQKYKIVLNNFNGKAYGDNPKYIADELLRQKLPYQLVWIIKKGYDAHVPPSIKTVKVGSWRAAYEYATARIIICNTKQRLPFYKKKDQYYIQTWHGAFILKCLEKEAEKQLSKRYIRHSIKDSSITDVMLSGSVIESDTMRRFFWYSGEIYECGQPRDDIFFNYTEHYIKELRHKYHIPLNAKVAVYAPTFRDNMDTSVYVNLDLERFRLNLQCKTGDKWIVVVRLHPNIASKDLLFAYNENVLNGSQNIDGQELFLLSDLLITDYSSVMMDFGLMRKPVFLFIPDLEAYRENRGLKPLFDMTPFPHCCSNEELEKAILSFDESSYQEDLRSFTETYYRNFSDGHASERVVERIKQVIDGTFKG